jgi:hypothetical protein
MGIEKFVAKSANKKKRKGKKELERMKKMIEKGLAKVENA